LRKRNRLLKSILIAAPKLTCLEIEFKEHFDSSIVYADLEYIIGSVKISYVETVNFAGFSFSERDIINFLERHRSTLKRVVLKVMYLENRKTWSGLASVIRNLKLDCSVRFEAYLWIKDGKIEEGLDTSGCFGEFQGALARHEEGNKISPTSLIESYTRGDSDFNPLQRAYHNCYKETCWSLGGMTLDEAARLGLRGI
jgi:hypothetical protein